MYLSIIVPLLNEEDSVRELLRRISEAAENGFDGRCKEYEIVLIDDGSTDRTWDIICELTETHKELRGVQFRRNYGQTSAMVAGFEYAKGDVIITMDGDLQNDPADIPMILDELEKGWDIVSGWRKNRKDFILRVLPSRAANFLISMSTGVWLHDYGCSLKAYRAECIRPLKAYGEMHRFFPALASMTGARVKEVPVSHHAREFGTSKYGFNRIWKVFSDIFAMNLIIRFSSMPLKAFGLLSLPCMFLAMFFGLFGGIALLFEWENMKGYLFIVVALLSLTVTINMIVLGILGELIVGTSDLSHTQMPELTKRSLGGECNE